MCVKSKKHFHYCSNTYRFFNYVTSFYEELKNNNEIIIHPRWISIQRRPNPSCCNYKGSEEKTQLLITKEET